MTWHDEKEPPVYRAGERTEELESLAREARRRRPFTRVDLNKTVRVPMGDSRHTWHEIGRVYNVDEEGLVLVPTSHGLQWFESAQVERGRVVETWEPEE